MVDLSLEDIERIKEDTSIQIGRNIRRIREEKGINQSDFAAMIQSDRQYQYKIEKGKVGISVAKLAVIAAALKVSLKDLVDFELSK